MRQRLPEHHLSPDSKDAVKLAMGLVATMTALLLGLLVSSAKSTFDTARNEVIQMAAKLTLLDRLLYLYGPGANEAREELHNAVQEAVKRLWPQNGSTSPIATIKPLGGDVFYRSLHGLEPKDDLQRSLKTQSMSLAMELGQLRTLLQAQAVPSVARPLLFTVACWLLLTFLAFSLLAPTNATTTLSFVVSAFSVATALFLILELDRPLGGWIEISPLPMENVIKQFSQ